MRRILALALCGGVVGWAAASGFLTAGRLAIGDSWSEAAVVPAANDIRGGTPSGRVEELARDSYERAADQALSLESRGAQLVALRRIAREWALREPAAAMAYGKRLPSAALRDAFCEEVLGQWWRLDPNAALAAGAEMSAGPSIGGSAGAYDPLAPAVAVAPEAALAALETYPPAMRNRVRVLAHRAIAERDPDAVRAVAEPMLAGQEREQLLSYVADSWVRRDPDAAVAWVESLNPPSRLARWALIEGLAQVDFDRAVELVLADENGAVVARLPVEQNLDRMPALMDRLLAMTRGVVPRELLVASMRRDTVLGWWASSDPEGALRWLADRGITDARLIEIVADRFTTRGAQAAAAVMQRVPSAMQPAWINAVAADFARTNASQALSWIEQFRGRQGYDAWVTTIVQTAADRDPEAAAGLLRGGDSSVRRNTPYVARNLARLNPVRASEWAASLAEPAERDAAAAMIAAQWASTDAAAARRWAFAAPGSMRDAAVAALFESQIALLGLSRNVDLTLLDAIADRATTQRLVRVALPSLARDPAQARELIDRFVFDPAEKRAALEELERLKP